MDISSLPTQVMDCGHEACAENIYVHRKGPNGPYYRCRECRREKDRSRYNQKGKVLVYRKECDCGAVTSMKVSKGEVLEVNGVGLGILFQCPLCEKRDWTSPE